MEIALEQFVENLVASGLMSTAEVAAFQESLPRDKHPADAAGLARILVQRRILTRYQAAAVYQGKTRGLVLGEYTVLERIGSGGMGLVYKAKHRTMDRVVALKILPSALMESEDAIRRFRREVRAAARLMHPNIVTALDAGEQDGIHYLVMEYVDGQDLARIVHDRGPLGVRETIDCILQAARGLAYAHEQGVLHRDIKPGNLLLDGKGKVRILDMGLARIDQMAGPTDSTVSLRVSSPGRLLGTCDYMAPEQADNIHYVDSRVDIYSLGCTLYRLLTAEAPYRGTAAQVLLAHREAAIPSLGEARPEVPPQLDAVFRKMVAKQPGNRHRSMAEVIADLEACLPVRQPGSVSPATTGDASELTSFLRSLSREYLPTAAAIVDEDEDAFAEPLIDDIEPAAGLLRTRPLPSWKRPVLLAGVLAGVMLVLVLGLLWAFGALPRSREVPSRSSQSPQRFSAPKLTADNARQYQAYWAERFGLDVERSNSLGTRLVLVPQGDFAMGSTRAQIFDLVQSAKNAGARQDAIDRLTSEGPQHPVSIVKPYYIGEHELTVAEFRRFVEATGYQTDAERDSQNGPSPGAAAGSSPGPAKGTWGNPGFAQSDSNPVVHVSWNDATEFCRWLSEKEGRRYRLPTEAEWEYACRAGTATRYSFGDAVDAFGWHQASARQSPQPVGQKKPNAWNVHDMHGNVEEWCHDWYEMGSYEKAPPLDLGGPDVGSRRVVRGGGWDSPAVDCRSASRNGDDSASHRSHRGFRIVLVR